MNERAVVFGCEGDELVGVVSVPEAPPDRAVVIVVGGPQYRVGSHRQFVRLAWHLAEHGVAAMRFDTRGMGDSSGRWRMFDDVNADVCAAIDTLFREVPTLRSVALWGLCGGATAALLYWQETRDPRVGAFALVNPWVRTDTTQARTFIKHYYLQRLLTPDFWRKLLRGGIALASLRDLWRALRLSASAAVPSGSAPRRRDKEDFGGRMADAVAEFSGRTLLILSENDYTAREFLETAKLDKVWQRNFDNPLSSRLELPGADHTFPQSAAHASVERATLELACGMP